jgi:hypothetical protein
MIAPAPRAGLAPLAPVPGWCAPGGPGPGDQASVPPARARPHAPGTHSLAAARGEGAGRP